MKVNSEKAELNYEVDKERRAAPRFSKNDIIECVSINSEKCLYLFEGVNISTQGIGFISQMEFKEEDFLEIIVLFDKSISIQVLVRVIRCNVLSESFFVGAEFVGMSRYNSEILKSVLDGCLDNI